MRFHFALTLLAGFAIAGCSKPNCSVPASGSCSTDSDCVLAYCADEPCAACDCGTAIAARQLDASACLVERGGVAPAGCSTVNTCDCFGCAPAAARCVSGTCARVALDGGP